MTDDYMTQIAYASNYYENAPEAIYIPSQDGKVIKKNFFDWINEIFIPHTVEVAEAQETQEKLIKNLSLYTDSTEEAIKELDFVRTQVDHLAMEYSQIAAAYADLYKLTKSVNYSKDELHNLLISTMLAGFRENLSEEEIARILSQMGEMLQNEYVSLDEFKKTLGYKFKAAANWSKEAPKAFNIPDASGDSIFNSAVFLDMFADYIKDNTEEVKPKDFNSSFVKANYYENRMFDRDISGEESLYKLTTINSGILNYLGIQGKDLPKIYSGITKFKNTAQLLGSSSIVALGSTWAALAYANWYESNKRLQQRYNNANDLQYIQQAKDLFDTKTEVINLSIDNTIAPDSYADLENVPEETELHYINLNNNDLINSNIKNTEQISHIYPIFQFDFTDSVKQIIAETLDDFAQLKGFKKKTV